jgi:hypothetical protein
MNAQDRKQIQKLKAQLKEAISFLDRIEKESLAEARKKAAKRRESPLRMEPLPERPLARH